MFKIITTSLFITSLALSLGLWQGTFQKNSLELKADHPMLDSAQANYRSYCAGCHGEKMEAFVDRRWVYGNKRQDIFKAIKNGYVKNGMPGFDSTFSDQEIEALADYILEGIKNVDRYKFADEKAPKSNVFKAEAMSYRLDTVAKGLDVPWGMAFLPNGDMLIAERSGTLFRRNPQGKMEKIIGVPKVKSKGQGGLLDVELHPDFEKNALIYISYSKPEEGGGDKATTAIMRAKLQGNALSEQKVIFEALPYLDTEYHFGCRLEFDREGYLYFSVGDRGKQFENPQNLDNHCGKIHRIKDDGSIPSDNPFVNTPNAKPTIYSYGHRNPQGVALNPADGTIWTHEHGPRGGDEVNIIGKAKNYGWPVISYGINYDGTTFTNKTTQEGMEQPLIYWLPSIAPCGMSFVKGDRYPAWKGQLLVGSLRFKYLNLCTIENNQIVKQEFLMQNMGRVRNVEMGRDGYIYVAVEEPGYIFKITPLGN